MKVEALELVFFFTLSLDGWIDGRTELVLKRSMVHVCILKPVLDSMNIRSISFFEVNGLAF